MSFDFCIPTRSTIVPDGPDWLHEVKYDGYRLRVERDGDRVRLITRGGYGWTWHLEKKSKGGLVIAGQRFGFLRQRFLAAPKPSGPKAVIGRRQSALARGRA